MKILLIHQYYLEEDDGGGSRFNEMTRVWADRGHEIQVLAGMMHANAHEKRPEYRGKYYVRKDHGSVSVLRCHVSEAYNRGFIGRLWGYFSFVFSSLYGGLFKLKKDYDVILVTSPPLFVGITALLLSLIRKKPFVFEVRDLWPESAIDTGVLRNKAIIRLAYWFEAMMYRKARLINVLTPAFRSTLINKKNVPADKVIFIPNAADFTLAENVLFDFNRSAFRRKMGWDDRFVITYVGAHGVANHLMQLVEVAQTLTDVPVHFVLIGDGMEKPHLRKEVNERGLKNIEFIDPVPKREVFRYIAASEFGTSVLKRVDTFKTIYSNKTFDYMSCRRPILLLIDGVSRELVETAGCGVYAEPENIRDIANKIRSIYSTTEDERNAMGVSGYTYARAHFDREELALTYETALREAIELPAVDK
ncbi:glycosyltransferase family 4 protein [Lewinella sp. JB7]|uniref:glycosyltransferase family 4 protein n=1 Tax=Lewinella sp. JB7 TaxID=2962887 RepID=UPI0020C9CEE6|nr:glycosyltransferase family 4 protein [Lewinella sp. JB7]MCP9236769.1 glycosyltransferase family 4 protein [Lewinella sp. JB7]